MDFIISKPLRDAILQYLMKRPFDEVAQAIPALQSLEEFDAAKKDAGLKAFGDIDN